MIKVIIKIKQKGKVLDVGYRSTSGAFSKSTDAEDCFDNELFDAYYNICKRRGMKLTERKTDSK